MFETDGHAAYCKQGQIGSPYRSGRVDHWLKVKEPESAVKRDSYLQKWLQPMPWK